MMEVTISKKLNDKKRHGLINFLCSLSTEVCFTAAHHYHVSEDDAVEMINEYKLRCKEKHHDLTFWYGKQEPYLLKTLKKMHIKTDEQFEEYKERVYQTDMML